jgi:transcriptional regulator with XRE-family HTH domain
VTRPSLGDDYEKLGTKLRYIRESAGKTLKDIKGVSPSHLSLVESGRAKFSGKILDKYVALGGDREELYALYKKAKGLGGQESGINIKSRLTVENRSFFWRFSESGAALEQEAFLEIRALTSFVDPEINVQVKYLADSRRGVQKLEPKAGCRVYEEVESESGEITAKLVLHKLLHPQDGLYPLSYRVLVDSHARSEPKVSWTIRTPHARSLTFQLIFHVAMRPLRAWWFSSVRYSSIEPHPSRGMHLDILDEGRYIYKRFEEDALEPNGLYGVAWVWP